MNRIVSPKPPKGWLRNPNSLFYEENWHHSLDETLLRSLVALKGSEKAHMLPLIGWRKNAIFCMILRITLDVNQKRIKLRAISLS